MNACCGTGPGGFGNWTPEQLDAAILSIQQAILDLTIGKSGQAFAYTQGDGSKSVQYTRADLGSLRALLQEFQVARYGRCARRRPIGFRYR